MICKKIKEKFPDYLTGDLDQKNKEIIQSHLASCPTCREELESLTAVWTKLGVLPEEQPSPALRNEFYTMLEAYKKDLEPEKTTPIWKNLFKAWPRRFWSARPAFQFSMALLLLVAGGAVGYFLNSNPQNRTEIADLRQEVHSMRQTLAVSLLDQPSPSERLRGVSLSYNMRKPDDKLTTALIQTLNNDQNVNVRLAAVDALYLFYENPLVKESVISSLSTQASPLVQVALIDLIVNMRERRAVDALRLLIKDEKINPSVKQRVEQGLQQLSF